MKPEPKSDQALVLRDSRIEPWRDPEWQRLWLSMQGKRWRALAVVPAGVGAPKDFSLRVAVTLARTGMVHLGAPVQVADATRVPLAYLATFLDEVRRCVKDGELILVALAPTESSPVTLPIAHEADAALLCVLLGRMRSSQARRTVAEIGAGRFLGSAIFRSMPGEGVEPELDRE